MLDINWQEAEREVHGRLTPASQKSRGYKIGEFVQIHADADMANPNSVIKHTPKGSKDKIDVLAVNGKVVRLLRGEYDKETCQARRGIWAHE